MTTPAKHQAFNVIYSVYRHVKLNFAVPHPEWPVNADDAFWDADRRDRTKPVVDRWVTLQPLSNTAGQRGALLLQVKCSGRVGTVAHRVSDRYGTQFQRMVQAVRDLFMVKDIDLYDFTVDPSNPTRIPLLCVFSLTSTRKMRVPESHQVIPRDQFGVRHEVFLYRFQTPYDGAGGDTYDTGV